MKDKFIDNCIPYSAKVKTPLNREGLQTFGHYGTRVSCQELAPRGGLTLALHGIYK
jgi:hypothetical protein